MKQKCREINNLIVKRKRNHLKIKIYAWAFIAATTLGVPWIQKQNTNDHKPSLNAISFSESASLLRVST